MEACRRVGRDPATLTITVGVTVRYPEPGRGDAEAQDDATPPSPCLTGTPDEIAAGLSAHAAAGAGHVIAVLEPCTRATVAAFADAVTRFRAGSGDLQVLDPAG